MLAIALSLLFGFIAFATLAELYASIAKGVRRGRLILEELARAERGKPAAVSLKITLPHRQPRPLPQLAAA